MKCAEPNPARATSCILDPGPHLSHTDGTDWWDNPYAVEMAARAPSAATRRKSKARMLNVVRAARRRT